MIRTRRWVPVFTIAAGLLTAAVVNTTPASAQPGGQLWATWTTHDAVHVPPGTSSVSAAATQNGTLGWGAFLNNYTSDTVTNPTVTMNSGYDPSLFYGAISAFPATFTQDGSLAPGGQFAPAFLPSAIPVSFTLGYDSHVSVTPAEIPPGGGQQTVTVTVTLTDPAYQSGPFLPVHIRTNVPGVSVASVTDPGNLTNGEQLQSGPLAPPDGLYQWGIQGAVLNKQYTFSLVLNVPNPSAGNYEYYPVVFIGPSHNISEAIGSGSSVTIADPTLDGPVPGSGAATFSVSETGFSWYKAYRTQHNLWYDGTEQPPPGEFDFTGFFAPVKNPPAVNAVRVGSAIPVKFSLGGDQGLNIFADGSPSWQQIACDTKEPVGATSPAVNAGGSSLSYNPATDRYTDVLSTPKGWAGTCQRLDVEFSDGSHYDAYFEFH